MRDLILGSVLARVIMLVRPVLAHRFRARSVEIHAGMKTELLGEGAWRVHIVRTPVLDFVGLCGAPLGSVPSGDKVTCRTCLRVRARAERLKAEARERHDRV